jgi:phage-related protein
MALKTFSPNPLPSPGTTIRTTAKVKKAEFGDGYTQRTADGLNNLNADLDLVWEFLTHAQASAIVAFFEEHAGYRSFIYKPHNAPAAMKWTCEEWSDSIRDDGFRKVTATLTRSYTLES